MDFKFQKGWTMKTVSLLSLLVVAVCLIGCENAELVTCQQEKDVLQGQLDQANTAITEKETSIKALKTENTELQTKAMESITTMMQKQAKKDNQIKQKLTERVQEIQTLKEKAASLQAQIDAHVCVVPEELDHDDDDDDDDEEEDDDDGDEEDDDDGDEDEEEDEA